MKRFLIMLAAITIPSVVTAQSQVLTPTSHDGYDVDHATFTTDGFLGQGDALGLRVRRPGYLPFTLYGVDVRSWHGVVGNNVVFYGYTTQYIADYNAALNAMLPPGAPPADWFGSNIGSYPDNWGTPSYRSGVVADPTGFFTLALNWTDLGAVLVDAFGGHDPLDPTPTYTTVYTLNNIAVTATPEPGTLGLVAAGLLGLLGGRRRRRSA